MKINSKTIIKDNNPLLRQRSSNVNLPLSSEDKDVLLSMYEYVKNSIDEEIAEKEDLKPAVGIAASQIGVLKRMNVIRVVMYDRNDNEVVYEYALVNAKIISESVQKAYLKSGEGCLSVPKEHKGYVPRSARITVKAYDLLQDKEVKIKFSGYLAIVVQHELDHNEGILYYDHINKNNPFQEIENAIVID